MDYYEKMISVFNKYVNLFQQTISPLRTTYINESLIDAFTSAFSSTQAFSDLLNSSYETMQASLLSTFPLLQNAIDSLILTPDVLESCAASFRDAYKDLLLIDTSESLHDLQATLSRFAEQLPIISEKSDCIEDDFSEDSFVMGVAATPAEAKKHRFDITLVLTILSFLLSLQQSISSEIESRHEEIRHHQEIQIKEESLRLKEEELRLKEEELCLMEEQRDYLSSVCEQLLTILDESESTPSPAPTPESTPPISDTAEISSPLEFEVVPDTGSTSPLESEVAPGTDPSSDDVSDNQSKNSETD